MDLGIITSPFNPYLDQLVIRIKWINVKIHTAAKSCQKLSKTKARERNRNLK